MLVLLNRRKKKMHWYAQDGTPRYGATIRQARKEGLLPGPSEVLSLLEKPELNDWRIEHILSATYDIPRRPGESYGAYGLRILETARKPSDEAIRIGNVIHRMIERFLQGGDPGAIPEDIQPIWTEVREWLERHLHVGAGQCEKILTNLAFGYAGRMDYLGPEKDSALALIDFKSQCVKEKKGEPFYWRTWLYQLSSYEWACHYNGIFPGRIMNVVISTNLHCLGVWEKEWSLEDRAEGFEIFRHMMDVFRQVNRIPYIYPATTRLEGVA